MIVSQDTRSAEWFRRAEGGWERIFLADPGDAVRFEGSGVELTLGEIYEGIDFE